MLLTVKEVAEKAGLTGSRVYQLIREGRLEVRPIDGLDYVTSESLGAWLEAKTRYEEAQKTLASLGKQVAKP